MKYTRRGAQGKSKFGIKLSVYQIKQKEAGVAHIEVQKGHFEEFYNKKSTFVYYILTGRGAFFLDGKRVPVARTDLVVIPPMTKIYYIGRMKMLLTTVPAWQAKNEVHVRFIKRGDKEQL